MKRLALVALVLAASFPPPAEGSADEWSVTLPRLTERPRDQWEETDTTPDSGYYLHVGSWTVYYYDAPTDTLTPTTQTPIQDHYADVDVYARGRMPKPEMIHHGQCLYDFCVATRVAIVGNDYEVSLEVRAGGACDTKPLGITRNFGRSSEKVTWIEHAIGMNYCPPGRTSAQVLLDGLPAAADFSTY